MRQKKMNAIEFCNLVENKLGWEAPPGHNRLRFVAEAGKVNSKIATNPELYTWRNLVLAVELLVREKLTRTPVGVFAYVERAVEMGRELEGDLETQIREICRIEEELGDPDGWVGRFSRAHASYRALAVEEWKASRQLL